MIETSSIVTTSNETPKKSITSAGQKISLPDYINNNPDYIGFTGYKPGRENQKITLHYMDGTETRLTLSSSSFVATKIQSLDLSFDPKLAA
jgi:hypothetical protein